MAPHYLLTFGTTMGRSRTLRINNPNADLPDSYIRAAMNGIIDSAAVEGTTGRANSIQQAFFVETHVLPIELSL